MFSCFSSPTPRACNSMLSFHIYPSSMHEMSPMADRISSLPNTLIYHVLSFLPTKEAAATSVLSKKWRPMWLSVSTLHFDDQTYSENEETYFRFLELVYTVMLLRDVSQPIQMFNLECSSLEMQISTYSKLFGPLKTKLPKLIRADIRDSFVRIPAATFYNVQFLRTEVVSTTFFPANSSTFLYLTYMELFFDSNYWSSLITFLHQCPNLQSLLIGMVCQG
ncbi:hypothetical protein VNO78_16025 [Psophocarpus tetragonolobus]|uniref:F-box domain-containing protein n=1 Tax=Psophocarpus tetragonolobus TaxID=3891 RepID=A0AAN9SGF3_PSOTE